MDELLSISSVPHWKPSTSLYEVHPATPLLLVGVRSAPSMETDSCARQQCPWWFVSEREICYQPMCFIWLTS